MTRPGLGGELFSRRDAQKVKGGFWNVFQLTKELNESKQSKAKFTLKSHSVK